MRAQVDFMIQLSGHEAGFLYADTPTANANVSLLHIHDQATAPGGVVRFKSILAHIERRLHLAPLFRQRLQRVPMGLDHPYWVDDQYFDLEYHLRHIALPKPGDWRQFCIQVSRIHARPLDLDRPLWEAYVIEGLDSFLDLPAGSFALLLKTHLAAVDLAGLANLSRLLYDTEALPPAPAPPVPWFADSPPGTLQLVGRGLTQSAAAPLRLAKPLARAVTRVAPAAVALASDMLLRPEQLPVTRFNSVVSPHRVFETRRFAEAEFALISRLVPGASVDDVVLAVCGGALRRYLQAQGELPEGVSLSAILPPAGDAPLAWRHVHLGTHLADELTRLAAVVAQSAAAPDALARTLGDPALAELASRASAGLLAWSRRWVGAASARLGSRSPPANVSMSLLPSPSQPLYLCGARLTYFSAILPISDGLGLAFAVTRYDGRLVISPTACRELVPDPELLAQCLRDSFQAYWALVQHLPAPPAQAAARVKKARPGKQGKTTARAQPAAQVPPVQAAHPAGLAHRATAGRAAVKSARPGGSVRGTTRRPGPRA